MTKHLRSILSVPVSPSLSAEATLAPALKSIMMASALPEGQYTWDGSTSAHAHIPPTGHREEQTNYCQYYHIKTNYWRISTGLLRHVISIKSNVINKDILEAI